MGLPSKQQTLRECSDETTLIIEALLAVIPTYPGPSKQMAKIAK